MSQLLLTGKMEVGEHHLTLAYQRILRCNGFLHLDNHIGLCIDILDGRQNLCAHLLIGLIAETTALPCSMLYEHLMSATYQLGHT